MEAATAATCPSTMYTGSMRIEPNAMWDAESATGTSRLVTSSRFGVSDRYAIGYGSTLTAPPRSSSGQPPTSTLPSFFTMPLTTSRWTLCESMVYAASAMPSSTTARPTLLCSVITYSPTSRRASRT